MKTYLVFARKRQNVIKPTMTTIPDITIIGGGIIGLLTARELTMAGARVSILEKNAIRRESSWANPRKFCLLMPIQIQHAQPDFERSKSAITGP